MSDAFENLFKFKSPGMKPSKVADGRINPNTRFSDD